jgi:hypothetical protein
MSNCGDFNDQPRSLGALLYPRTSTVERRVDRNDVRRLLSLWGDQTIGNDRHFPLRSSPAVRGSQSRSEFLCSILEEALAVSSGLDAQPEIVRHENTHENSPSSTTSEKKKSDKEDDEKMKQ